MRNKIFVWKREIIMNKTSKVCVATTLALGTLIGVTVVENSAPTSKQAQAKNNPILYLQWLYW